MTRINIGIEPKLIKTKHLLAEHREIKRIPNTIRSGKAIIKDIPNEFCLGKGHVKFFYNKLGYLLNRYKQIHNECLYRKCKVTDYSGAWKYIQPELMSDYMPTVQDIEIISQRLKYKGAFI